MEPGTRITFQPTPDAPVSTGTILKPRRWQLPLPSPEWRIVRFDDGRTLCVHQSAFAS